MTNAVAQAHQDKTALYVYYLYLAGIFLPFTGLIGLIMAYVNKGKDPVIDSYYSHQIRTFWWGLLWMVIGGITAVFVIGYLILIGWMVWLIMRCVKGIQAFNAGVAIA